MISMYSSNLTATWIEYFFRTVVWIIFWWVAVNVFLTLELFCQGAADCPTVWQIATAIHSSTKIHDRIPVGPPQPCSFHPRVRKILMVTAFSEALYRKLIRRGFLWIDPSPICCTCPFFYLTSSACTADLMLVLTRSDQISVTCPACFGVIMIHAIRRRKGGVSTYGMHAGRKAWLTWRWSLHAMPVRGLVRGID